MAWIRRQTSSRRRCSRSHLFCQPERTVAELVSKGSAGYPPVESVAPVESVDNLAWTIGSIWLSPSVNQRDVLDFAAPNRLHFSMLSLVSNFRYSQAFFVPA